MALSLHTIKQLEQTMYEVTLDEVKEYLLKKNGYQPLNELDDGRVQIFSVIMTVDDVKGLYEDIL